MRSGRRAPPGRLRGEIRRDQLVALGETLFSQMPYDEVSIEEIAKRAGISKGLLYHYFRDKRGFYLAVVEHAAQRLLRAISVDASSSLRERAEQGLRNYLDFAEAHSVAFVGLLRGGIGADPQVLAIVERTRERIAEQILSHLDGKVSPRLRLLVRSFIAFVEASTIEWIQGRPISKDEVIALWLDTLFFLLNHPSKMG
ncbi:MAG: TetR/AcrR family transcriptional regulator [Sandaracinaceae bacterium]|nr:TetR/AcrR family transcriptional regulator [Sandaracinaceae bacterium]MDW8246030.1 TetR/AcrR family transcriptional regulator [Sandaracinaceae bacterium]